jgi:hypothetical protein
MTQKKNDVQAVAAETSITEKLADFERQKEYFNLLTSKINQRAALMNHLERIKSRRENADFDDLIDDPENLDRDSIGKITLYFDSNRHQGYEIVNSNLLKRVADFIQSELAARINQVESEISVMK